MDVACVGCSLSIHNELPANGIEPCRRPRGDEDRGDGDGRQQRPWPRTIAQVMAMPRLTTLRRWTERRTSRRRRGRCPRLRPSHPADRSRRRCDGRRTKGTPDSDIARPPAHPQRGDAVNAESANSSATMPNPLVSAAAWRVCAKEAFNRSSSVDVTRAAGWSRAPASRAGSVRSAPSGFPPCGCAASSHLTR